MSTDTLAAFEDALGELDVGVTRVEADGVPAALDELVEPPAVGAPLGIEGVALADVGITTEPTPRELDEAETGVARVGAGIAEYGTLVVQSDAGGTEPVSLYPPRHVGVLRGSDVVADVETGLEWFGEQIAAGRNSAVLATGPSKTADMGGLVYGAHGPKEVHVLVVTDR